MPDERVLVVGTTSDYVDAILRRHPGRVLFVTAPGERARANEPPPDERSEVLCDLTSPAALAAVKRHMQQLQIRPTGVACYDCESLDLASRIASDLGLPFPSVEAIAVCRNKFLSKAAWQRAGLPCPAGRTVGDLDAALRFMERVGGPVVLKPLTGSGSELVFRCAGPQELAAAVATLQARLAAHPDHRMYASGGPQGADVRRRFVVEQFVEGTEYSCDFVTDGASVQIIRIARKVPCPGQPIGTILAYVIPSDLPPEVDPAGFRRQLLEGARAVGLTRALVMLDFIVRDGRALMIEIAPRPGGDCLPWLLQHCCGLDVLGCELDFAEGRPLVVPEPSRWRRLVGLRLFAAQEGIVRRLDASALLSDPAVLECTLVRGPGHRVVLPPRDYNSRLLGHVIIDPSGWDDLERGCVEAAARLKVEMEGTPCATAPKS